MKPEEFLTMVNKANPDHGYAFAQPIDLVIVGPCSALPIPMAPALIDDATPNKEYFDWLLGAFEEGTVLVIAECCGQYSDLFQERLKVLYPKITWVFPNIADYCDYKLYEKAGKDLEQLGVLKPN